MKKTGVVILVIVVILAVLAGAGWYFKPAFLSTIFGNGSAKVSEDAVAVERIADLMGNGAANDRYAGVIESGKAVDIKKDYEKTVKEVLVSEGQEVKVGDVLFTYDVDALTLSLKKLQLEYDGMTNRIETLKAQLASLTAERDKAPEANKLQYSLEIRTTELDIQTEEYNQTLKQTEIDAMQQSIDNADVLSEVSGNVTAVNENGGTDNMGNEKPLITIRENTGYRIKCSVSELGINSLYEGMEMTVISRVDQSQTWTGTVTEVDREPEANDNSGIYYGDSGEKASKYNFYVMLENMDGLMVGQHVFVTQAGAAEKTGVWIPSSYISYNENGESFVYAEADGKLTRVTVELGNYDMTDDSIEVLSGLSAEDYIAFPMEEYTEGAPAFHASEIYAQ